MHLLYRLACLAGLIFLTAGCTAVPEGSSPDAHYRLVAPPSPADSAGALRVLGEIRELSPDLFETGTTTQGATTLRYRLLPPAAAQPDQTYPLVVVFHGAGEIGVDNRSHLDAFVKTWARPAIRERFPAFVLAPQMPERSAIYSGPAETPGRYSQPGQPLYAALELIDELMATRPIDPDRVYAVGFSMGASTVWNAVALRPTLFAAGVPISGVPNPASRIELANTPLWIVHGNADTANLVGPDREIFAALRQTEGANVRFWEYDQMHHGVPLDLLTGDALMTWLFTHSR